MVRHVFLTGEKQVGKSTLLKKILNSCHCEAGGFFTLRTNEFLKTGYSVHMFDRNGKAVPNEKNLLFVCNKNDLSISEKFDRLGCKILSECS